MTKMLEKLFALIAAQSGLDPLPFNPPATDAAIAEAEKTLGLTLPDDYKAFLRHCDGQSDMFALTFPPDQLAFLPIAEVVQLWQELNAAPDDTYFDSFDESGLTRNVLQHPRRIPIAQNESGGAYLQIDYVPGPSGKEGQLVFNFNEIDLAVVADSMTDLIGTYVRLLEAGKMRVTKQPPEFGEGTWFEAALGEMLDWAAYEKIRDDGGK